MFQLPAGGVRKSFRHVFFHHDVGRGTGADIGHDDLEGGSGTDQHLLRHRQFERQLWLGAEGSHGGLRLERRLSNAANLAGHFGQQVDRENDFLVGLQRLEVPHEDALGRLSTLGYGAHELRASRNRVQHDDVVCGGGSNIAHANLERGRTIHLDLIRSRFFDDDRRRLLPFQCSITGDIRREFWRAGRSG